VATGCSGRGKIFIFSIASRSALGLIQPPVQWVPRVRSPDVKRPGREAGRETDRSTPSSAEVKNDGAIPPFLHMPSWRGA
jgi:hypothetical protein